MIADTVAFVIVSYDASALLLWWLKFLLGLTVCDVVVFIILSANVDEIEIGKTVFHKKLVRTNPYTLAVYLRLDLSLGGLIIEESVLQGNNGIYQAYLLLIELPYCHRFLCEIGLCEIYSTTVFLTTSMFVRQFF